MKILITYQAQTDSDNPFVRTLARELVAIGYDVSCSVTRFWQAAEQYNVIHVQWPEELFRWQNPTDAQLAELEQLFARLHAKGTPILYTRHNVQPHYGDPQVVKAYRLVEQYADVIVHLGKYSQTEFLATHPASEQRHVIIPHHIYDQSYDLSLAREECRRQLHIPNDRFVILAFGAFRHNAERRLVWRAFRAFPHKNKYLLAPRLLPFAEQPPSYFSWKKRLLSRIGYYVTRLISRWLACRVVAENELVSQEELPIYLNACDVVFIQRTELLNSGNLPLGLLFGKVIVGPDCGNIKEMLVETGNPVFDSHQPTSVDRALAEAYRLAATDKGAQNKAYALLHLSVRHIAEMYGTCYDQLFKTTTHAGE
ncbi:MAG: hypothetical protein RR258_03755 [Alistipes sp.]